MFEAIRQEIKEWWFGEAVADGTVECHRHWNRSDGVSRRS